MLSLARILFCSAVLMSLSLAPVAFADDEDDTPSRRETAKEKREARRNRAKGEPEVAPAPKGSFEKEIAALLEAEAMLASVNDEARALEVSEELCKKFSAMPPILNGVDNELLELARAQNKVSRQMARLITAPFFEKSGLQQAWTLMTDHFSRRSAQSKRKK